MGERTTAMISLRDYRPPSREAAINAISFAINLFVVQTSMFGWYGETNSEMSRKYQTFCTPAGWAFSIWGYIFLSQTLFTVLQLLPGSATHRDHVAKAICLYWVAAQACQVGWTFAFAQEAIVLSVVLMIGIYVSLLCLTVVLHTGLSMSLNSGLNSAFTEALTRTGSPSRQTTWSDWILYHMPFQVHFAWITCATLININLVLVASQALLHVQLAAAVMTQGLALLSCYLFLYTRLDVAHAFVVSWALFALGFQLRKEDNPVPYRPASLEFTSALSYSSFGFSLICFAGGLCVWLWILIGYVSGGRRANGGLAAGRVHEGVEGGLLRDAGPA